MDKDSDVFPDEDYNYAISESNHPEIFNEESPEIFDDDDNQEIIPDVSTGRSMMVLAPGHFEEDIKLITDAAHKKEMERLSLFDGQGEFFYVRNFDDIKQSTITRVAQTDSPLINVDYIFLALPIHENAVKNISKKNGKITNLESGTIVSARWRGCTRGRSEGKFFKNCILIDMYINGVESSLKLSTKDKIQMCGSLSADMALKAAQLLVEKVNEAIDFGLSIRRDPKRFKEECQWLLNNCKGREREYEIILRNTGDTTFCKNIKDNEILFPETFPENFVYLQDLMLRIGHSETISDAKEIIDFFINVSLNKETVPKKSKVLRVGISMINKYYSLGFRVNREKFAQIMGEEGMSSDYANAIHSCAKIKTCSKIHDDEGVIRRRVGPCSVQTILVMRSGIIMHSGPGGDAMADCYYRLMNTIYNRRDDVAATKDE